MFKLYHHIRGIVYFNAHYHFCSIHYMLVMKSLFIPPLPSAPNIDLSQIWAKKFLAKDGTTISYHKFVEMNRHCTNEDWFEVFGTNSGRSAVVVWKNIP